MQAANVFVAVCTQWRSSFGGATGLDYAVLPAILELVGVPQAERLEVFNDLRTMEDAALAYMRKQRESRQ